MRFPRSFSLKRYAFDAELPAAESSEMVRRLGRRRFRPLTAHEERTYGWVSPENLLITDPEEAAASLGRRVLLAFRIDRRRVSARLLRARVDLEVRARAKAARDGAGSARLTREERAALR